MSCESLRRQASHSGAPVGSSPEQTPPRTKTRNQRGARCPSRTCVCIALETYPGRLSVHVGSLRFLDVDMSKLAISV